MMFLLMFLLLLPILFPLDVNKGADPDADSKMKGFFGKFSNKVEESKNYVYEMFKVKNACTVTEDYKLGLIVPALLVGFLLILISTIVYMLGQVLQSPRVIALAKEEYYHSFITIFLAFIVVSLTVAANMSLNVFGFGANDFIDIAMHHAYKITDQIATDLTVMTFFNGVLTYFAASSLSFGSFHSQISFSPGLALKPLTDVVTLVIQFLSVGLSEWLFHIFSLCMIKKWAISVFLPLGMLLRAIPHTRDGGSAIISLMVVLYFVYPATFIATGHIYDAVHANLDLQKISLELISQFKIGSAIISIFFFLIVQSIWVPLVLFGFVDTAMVFVKESMFMFFIMSLMLPFFSILIALTAAKELAKSFFQVEVNLSSIIRVI